MDIAIFELLALIVKYVIIEKEVNTAFSNKGLNYYCLDYRTL